MAAKSTEDTGPFEVDFVSGADGEDWPEAAKSAVEYALSIWAAYIDSDAPIRLRASWGFKDESPDENILAATTPVSLYANFEGAPDSDTWYAASLANALTGEVLRDASHEGVDEFVFPEDFVQDNGEPIDYDAVVQVNADQDWYTDTDGGEGNVPSDQFDLPTVILHEIGHALHFFGSFRINDDEEGEWGTSPENEETTYPDIFDAFVVDEDEATVIDAYENPSAAIADLLTGGVGSMQFEGEDGSSTPLHTPPEFDSRLSFNHFHEGEDEKLMKPEFSKGEAIHDPGITVDVLGGLGWDLAMETVLATAQRSFDDPTSNQNYRLVALPGMAGQELGETLSGTSGPDWRAFRETGDAEALDELAASHPFAAGKGIWVISRDDWAVDARFDAFTSDDDERALSLHDGWNIIANPLGKDINWEAVQQANDLGDRPLWQWEGSWDADTQTFASARNGEAYYFFNEEDRDRLTLPDDGGAGDLPALRAEEGSDDTEAVLELEAQIEGERAAGITVDLPGEGTADRGEATLSHRAPPDHFEAASLRITGDDAEAEYAHATVDVTSDDGSWVDLTLRADPETTVDVVPVHSESVADAEAVLEDRSADRRHTLADGSSIPVTVDEEGEADLRLLLGAAAATPDASPDEWALHPPYPNPSDGPVTIEYTAPDDAHVTLAVYNALGQEVTVLDEGPHEAGDHSVQWDGRAGGQAVPSGTYFVRLEANGQTAAQQVTIVR